MGALIEELRKFVGLQEALLTAWRAACVGSHDVDLLLDFPRRQSVSVRGIAWEAVRHGAGVQFKKAGVVVDVPRNVGLPSHFDSDRFYDYLASTGQLSIIPGDRLDGRQELASLFLQWTHAGILQSRTDSVGMLLFTFAR